MNCATGQGSRPFGFPVYVKLSCCTHCKRHYEWTSRVYVGIWSVEWNGWSEDECVTAFGSRDQFVTMVAWHNWFLGQ